MGWIKAEIYFYLENECVCERERVCCVYAESCLDHNFFFLLQNMTTLRGEKEKKEDDNDD
jgi:hypothetical protein